MAIKAGDKFPSVKLKSFFKGKTEDVDTAELFKNKKVALFGLPGAFTPTCSAKHLPGYVELAPKIHAKGIDLIVCMSVNDIFVMEAWSRSQNAQDRVMMLADGSAVLTKALGLENDLTAGGLGMRSQRFAMTIDNGTVKKIDVEKPKEFCDSTAEHLLESI